MMWANLLLHIYMYVYVHTDTKNIHMHAKGTVLFVKPCTLITFLQVVSHRNLAEGTFAGINMKKKKSLCPQRAVSM